MRHAGQVGRVGEERRFDSSNISDGGSELELHDREGRAERVVRVEGERHRPITVEQADGVGLGRAGEEQHEVAI